MALRIRLRRMGRKKAPTYRIVVAENTMPRDGRFVDILGHYNPRTEPMTIVVDDEKARDWMAQGAQPTDTVRSLFKRAGVFGGKPAEATQQEAPAAEPAAEEKQEKAQEPAAEQAQEEKPAAAEAAPEPTGESAEAPAEEETEKAET